MLKIGSKRRRTKAQIANDNEQTLLMAQETAQNLQELASLRARIGDAEQKAETNKAAATLMSQLINAGHVRQDTENTIVINAANGEHRFGVDAEDDNQLQ